MRLRGRRWWTRAIVAVAFVIVVAATLSAVFTLTLDVMPAWREALQARVAESVGAPVKIDAMRLSWRNLQPELALRGVTVLDAAGKPALHIGVLRVGVDYLALLHGQVRPARIELGGLAVTLDVDAQGHWKLKGLPDLGNIRALSHLLGGLARLRVWRCVVTIDDARLDNGPLAFNVHVAVDRFDDGDEPRYRMHLVAIPPAVLAGRLDVRVEVHGELVQHAAWSHAWKGRWQASVAGLRSVPWLDRRLGGGRRFIFDGAEIHAQGSLAGGRPTGAELNFNGPGVAVVASRRRMAAVQDVTARFTWKPDQTGWQLRATQFSARAPGHAAPLWNLAPAILQWHRDTGDWSFDATAATLPVTAITPWLGLWPRAAAQLKDWPGLHGLLKNVALHLHGKPNEVDATSRWVGKVTRFAVSADLKGIGWPVHGATPGVDGLSGQLKIHRDHGQFHVASAPTLHAPHVFFAPIKLDALKTTIKWQRGPKGSWKVNANPLWFELNGLDGNGHLQLSIPVPQAGGHGASAKKVSAVRAAPTVHLDMRFKTPDAARLKALMLREWSPHLRHWLTHALEKVPVKKAHLIVDGPLRGFPYVDRKDPGHWSLDAQLTDATLRFDPKWPVAHGLSATLHFAGDGMRVKVSRAQLGKVRVNQATASVPHFHHGVLTVAAQAAADMTDWYALLRASPLHGRMRALVDESTVGGPASVTLGLTVPLHDAAEAQVTGTAKLNGVRYQYTALPVPVTTIRGGLSFDRHGLTALQLDGKLGGEPVSAALATVAGQPALAITFKADPAHSALAARYLPAWLRPRLSGAAKWHLKLPLKRARDWTLSSSLRGTAINLPPPLAKPASSTTPVHVEATMAADGSRQLRIDGGRRFGLNVRYGGEPETVRGVGLRLGPGSPVDDSGHGVRIRAAVDQLDLGAWVGVLAGASFDLPGEGAAGELPFLGASITAGELYWGEARVKDAVATLKPEAGATQHALHIALSGVNARGNVVWNAAARSLHVDLSTLHLETLHAHGAPQATGAARPAVGATPARAALDPDALPTLNLHCKSLSVGKYALGTLMIRSVRVKDGQKVRTATLSGPFAGVALQGDWTRAAGRSSARIGFAVDLRRLGDALQAFGFARTVTAQRAHFTGSVAFPPAAGGLDLAQVKGKVDVTLDDGELTAVHPGIGRVFGLLNVYALPRRLLHKFRGVTDKGLAYDHMSAHFTLADGQARTRDARIVGPSVSLEVRGRIGLQAHDLDETVRVHPKIASGITLGAALLGGPIAGGVALLAQALVGKAINHLAELSYRVTGSWDDPKVEHVSSTRAPVGGEATGASVGTAVAASTAAPAAPATVVPNRQAAPMSQLPTPVPAASGSVPAQVP